MEYRRYPGLSSTEGPTDDGIVRWWWEEIEKNDGNGVYDRCFFISEMMYQPITVGRKLICMGTEFASGIEAVWRISPLIFFCLPEWSILTHNMYEPGRSQLQG